MAARTAQLTQKTNQVSSLEANVSALQSDLDAMTDNYNLAVEQRNEQNALYNEAVNQSTNYWFDLQDANSQIVDLEAENDTMLVELFGEDRVPGGDGGGLHGGWDFGAAGFMQDTLAANPGVAVTDRD